MQQFGRECGSAHWTQLSWKDTTNFGYFTYGRIRKEFGVLHLSSTLESWKYFSFFRSGRFHPRANDLNGLLEHGKDRQGDK